MKKLSCLLLTIAIVGLAVAAPGQQDGFNGPGDRFFPMLGRVLTTGQRQSLQQIVAVQRVQIQPLEEKLRASRQALLNQIASGNFDENLVRQYATQSASAEADLTVIFARALSRMQPPLSAEQIAQMKSFGPGRFKNARRQPAAAAPEIHLNVPPPLPRDTNDLPIMN